jgi:hypothetical protein
MVCYEMDYAFDCIELAAQDGAYFDECTAYYE